MVRDEATAATSAGAKRISGCARRGGSGEELGWPRTTEAASEAGSLRQDLAAYQVAGRAAPAWDTEGLGVCSCGNGFTEGRQSPQYFP